MTKENKSVMGASTVSRATRPTEEAIAQKRFSVIRGMLRVIGDGTGNVRIYNDKRDCVFTGSVDESVIYVEKTGLNLYCNRSAS